MNQIGLLKGMLLPFKRIAFGEQNLCFCSVSVALLTFLPFLSATPTIFGVLDFANRYKTDSYNQTILQNTHHNTHHKTHQTPTIFNDNLNNMLCDK